MPHNHQPRCCCQHVQDGAVIVQSVPCPSCTEHGELATLGNATDHCPEPDCPFTRPHYHRGDNEIVFTDPATRMATSVLSQDGVMRTSAACPMDCEHDHTETVTPAQPAECPSCHAVGDQPHTDYCQAPNSQRARAGYIAQPDRDGQRWHHVEGETCTEGNGMPDYERAVQAQTSQPAATTSQPPTHTRATSGPVTSGQPYTLKRGEGILTPLEHAMPGGRTHLRALCRPDLCGQQPTPSQ